jgi:site-specific DNA-adenine methylase
MRYPGGKGKCFQQLINLMPPHSVYIESHLGGGAVLRHKRAADLSIGIDIDPRVIQRWESKYPAICMLVNTDAASFLEAYRYKGDELIYADPPYVRSLRLKARIYRYDYELDQHIRLLHVLKSANCRVMISGYDGELYERELRQWRQMSFSVQSQAGSRVERVWLNFDPPAELHDGSFIGGTFRERQSMRRRQLRLLRRFDQMVSTERQHLLSLLSERYGTGGAR